MKKVGSLLDSTGLNRLPSLPSQRSSGRLRQPLVGGSGDGPEENGCENDKSLHSTRYHLCFWRSLLLLSYPYAHSSQCTRGDLPPRDVGRGIDGDLRIRRGQTVEGRGAA